MIGKTVSHYRIVGPLGSGGMGVVYAGEDVRLGRPVALKFVPEELAQDRQAIDRLLSEARTASGLNHPNICTIYDIGEYEGQPFIVMELLKGHSLRERLANGRLKTHEAVELGIHVADALDAAHRRDIIHRDIKPANLFLVEHGQVKILDFGLAKIVARSTPASPTVVTRDRTAEGVTLGTVSYMSPEQVTGEELDGRSDLFSLGVVLYEALTAHQPFTGKTSAMIFASILTRAPVAPVVFNPDLPLRLQEVINNCLEKDRELRYQDAAGLRADLRRIKRDLESGHSGVYRVSGSVAVGHESQPSSARGPATAPTAHSGARESEPQPALATNRRGSHPTIIAATVAVAATLATGAFFLLSSRGKAPSQSTQATASPAFVRSRLALATASIESKDYRAAISYADEVLRASPDDREATRIRDAARGMLTRFDNAVTEAGHRLAVGDVDGATSALATARSIDPTAPVLAELSARLASQRGAVDTARPGAPPAGSAAVTLPPPQRRTAIEPRTNAERPRTAPGPAPAPLPPPVVAPTEPQPFPQPPPSPREPAEPQAPAPAPAVRPTNPPTAGPPVAPVPPVETAPPPVAVERRDSDAGSARTADSDEAAIRRVVAAYARAIETKDLALFKSIKPNLSPDEQRRIEDGFRAVTSQQVSMSIVSIDQKGQDASVRLRRRDTIQAGGRRQTTESVQTMTLTRMASGWVIREIAR